MKQPDHEVTVTPEDIRSYFDGQPFPEELENVLDNAQGEVFSGEAKEITVLITIRK